MAVLRWGLLSTARINLALLPALRECTRAEAVAVASRDLGRASSFAAEHGLPVAYGSYEELIDDPDIDVVYNPLPNSLHAEWTIRAADAGKHVLCEKPLACTLAEVDAIAAAAERNSVVVAEAFMYRHHPQTRRVQEMAASGAIGDIRLVRGSFSFTLEHRSDIRLDADLHGGSAWDVGVYPVSYARTIFGEPPVAVAAVRHDGANGVDLTCAGTITFPGGGRAQFDSSFELPFRAHLEIVGSTGVIVVPNPFKPGTVGDDPVRSGRRCARTRRGARRVRAVHLRGRRSDRRGPRAAAGRGSRSPTAARTWRRSSPRSTRVAAAAAPSRSPAERHACAATSPRPTGWRGSTSPRRAAGGPASSASSSPAPRWRRSPTPIRSHRGSRRPRPGGSLRSTLRWWRTTSPTAWPVTPGR